jgi:hypothetical protein
MERVERLKDEAKHSELSHSNKGSTLVGASVLSFVPIESTSNIESTALSILTPIPVTHSLTRSSNSISDTGLVVKCSEDDSMNSGNRDENCNISDNDSGGTSEGSSSTSSDSTSDHSSLEDVTTTGNGDPLNIPTSDMMQTTENDNVTEEERGAEVDRLLSEEETLRHELLKSLKSRKKNTVDIRSINIDIPMSNTIVESDSKDPEGNLEMVSEREISLFKGSNSYINAEASSSSSLIECESMEVVEESDGECREEEDEDQEGDDTENIRKVALILHGYISKQPSKTMKNCFLQLNEFYESHGILLREHLRNIISSHISILDFCLSFPDLFQISFQNDLLGSITAVDVIESSHRDDNSHMDDDHNDSSVSPVEIQDSIGNSYEGKDVSDIRSLITLCPYRKIKYGYW